MDSPKMVTQNVLPAGPLTPMPGHSPEMSSGSAEASLAPSEATLVRMLIEGSEDALARLYDLHGQAVYAEARRTSRDAWVASEVVQETFLALWNRAEQFDPARGGLRSWLMTIAHNRAVDHLRRGNRHRAVAFSSLGDDTGSDGSISEWLAAVGEPVAAAGREPGPESAYSAKESRAAIAAAIATLAPLERSVIDLAYQSGLSQSEIAARLGWPLGTVKTRTRSALRHLRERIERGPVSSPRTTSAAVHSASSCCA